MKHLLLILLLISTIVHSQTRQPFSKLGKKVKVVTLSNGKYDEFFDEDTLQRVGSSVMNINTKRITKINLSQIEIDELENAQATRFLSVDAKADLQPYLTPYNFVGNRPIWAVDFDGNLDFIINYITKNQDGSVTKVTYSRPNAVTTYEDIKGITRTPVIINVYQEWTFVEQSPGVRVPQFKRNKVEIVENSGLTDAPMGEVLKNNDKIAYYGGGLLLSLSSLWGGKQAVTVMEGRDPETGEFISQGRKIGEIVSGVISVVTLGRGAATGKAKELIGGWAVDFFVEKTSKVLSEDYISKSLGWDSEQTSVFMFNLAKIIYDGRKLSKNPLAESLTNFVLSAIKTGSDGSKVAEELKKNFNININLPKDKKDATEIVLKSEGLK
jgi:hypothetical protein